MRTGAGVLKADLLGSLVLGQVAQQSSQVFPNLCRVGVLYTFFQFVDGQPTQLIMPLQGTKHLLALRVADPEGVGHDHRPHDGKFAQPR